MNGDKAFLHDLGTARETCASDWIRALLEKVCFCPFSFDLSTGTDPLFQHGLKAAHLVEDCQSQLTTARNEMEMDKPSPPLSIESLEEIDRADEDHNRTEQSRATGFLGKSSEILDAKTTKRSRTAGS